MTGIKLPVCDCPAKQVRQVDHNCLPYQVIDVNN